MEFIPVFSRIEEFIAILRFKVFGCNSLAPKQHTIRRDENLSKCYEFLRQTSRSFAAVIQALDNELRDAVCIFYLVLRALDTVEDDMTIPKDKKVDLLENFYLKMKESNWKYLESQEKDKIVLEQFPVISHEFRKLNPMYQTVISDICKRMGHGMIQYLETSPITTEDWDKYCHYVAGLVGIGLSKLFSNSKLEDKTVGENERLSNSMGLFLQKTNIIRDYLEDIEDGREFWPKEIWSKYCNKLSDLKQETSKKKALYCLDELVANALDHVPDCLEYMTQINNQSVFNFCAIPQVMAVATLERCYHNHDVFKKVVKIRKGEAVKMMMETTNMDQVKLIFQRALRKIENRASTCGDSDTCNKTRDLLVMTYVPEESRGWSLLTLCLIVITLLLLFVNYNRF